MHDSSQSIPGRRSMTRGSANSLLSILAWLLLIPGQGAWALGLGDITVNSYLGQPLNARIELISRSAAELGGISANLASADSFRLVGMDRMALSVPLNFVVHPDPANPWVEVRSLDAVNDPVLQFVVEVNFPNGRLLRQYTVFLDPPTVAAPVPLPSLTPRDQARIAPAVIEEPVVVEERSVAVTTPGEPVLPQPDVVEPAAGKESDTVAGQPMVRDAAEELDGSQPADGPDADIEPIEAAGAGNDSAAPEAVLETVEEQTETPIANPPAGPPEAPIEDADEASLPDISNEPDDDIEARSALAEPQQDATEPAPEAADTAGPVDEEPSDSPAAGDIQIPAEEAETVPDQADGAGVEAEEALSDQGEALAPDDSPGQSRESMEPLVQAETPLSEPASRTTPVTYQATREDLENYGPVERGQTLWGIAAELTRDTDYSINQMMLAIQRVNPNAFGRGNINLLKRGAILRLPPVSEVERMSVRMAMLEAMRQAEDYGAILAGRTPEPRPAPVLADPLIPSESPMLDEPRQAVETTGRLELVPPEEDGAGGAAGGDSGLSAGETAGADAAADAAMLSEEDIDVAEQESEYLSQRIQELREELGADETVVEVGDRGLAEMEQSLREQRTATETELALDARPAQSAPPWYANYAWWLLIAVLLLAGGVVAWLLRRGHHDSADTVALGGHSVGDPETEQPAGADGRQGSGDAASPVIDLEDYIGHVGDDVGFDDEEEEEGEPLVPALDEPGNDSIPEVQPEPAGDHAENDEGAGEVTRVIDTTGGEESEPDDEGNLPVDPETKLDLARAHIAMGDKEAARELLEEVISEGNEQQVSEARSMMEET